MEMERYKRRMECYKWNGWVVKRRLLPVRLPDDVFAFANALRETITAHRQWQSHRVVPLANGLG